MNKKFVIVLEVDEPTLNLENYPESDTYEDALKVDADLFEDGEITLDEFLHSYNGLVSVRSVAVEEADQ